MLLTNPRSRNKEEHDTSSIDTRRMPIVVAEFENDAFLPFIISVRKNEKCSKKELRRIES